jgi:hypothetical protein
MLLLSTDLSDGGCYWFDANICHFNSLVVTDFKGFVDYLRRTFNSQTLGRASALTQTTPS